MSTKIKGEAIKEGSIPLSALNDEVKDKIENAGGGADWNAQEGESGHIENRTHYLYDKSPQTLGKGINKIDYTHRKFILFNDTIQVLPEFENNLEIRIVSGPPVYLKYNVENSGEPVIELIDVANYFENSTIEFYANIKKIDEKFIPDTVLKTTPQELSDTDKNQALANLGIDPVVWKYMCEPFKLEDGVKIPQELRNIIWDNKLSKFKPISCKLLITDSGIIDRIGYDYVEVSGVSLRYEYNAADNIFVEVV